jgi:F0F1-type ATP synthase membrane subunit c/vacuolar-type H+-ATPase subunit K
MSAMMNRPANQSGADAELELRLRTLRILWGALLTTIGLYALITVFALPSRDALEEGRDNPTLLMAFAVMSFMSVAASFVLKRHFYGHAVERGEPAQFQIGFIFALAFCEVSALLGLMGLFITHNSYAYALFVLGALGQLLHFPRRDQVAATYRKRM